MQGLHGRGNRRGVLDKVAEYEKQKKEGDVKPILVFSDH